MKTILKAENYLDHTNKIDFKLLGVDPSQILVLSIAGSHMYGTNTEASDTDYLGIYFPTKSNLIMCDTPHHAKLPKSTGMDLQMWSIHHFIKLACQGETMALDLLHANDEHLLYYDDQCWDTLKSYRTSFYTRRMNAFGCYVIDQAQKYSSKGDRVNSLKQVIEFLNDIPNHTRLTEIWEKLPEGEYIKRLNDEKPFRMYEVNNRKWHETVTVEYLTEQLEKVLTTYGKRANLAARMDGKDWKALSHSIRVATQMYDIYTKGDYSYPLDNIDFIRSVKLGEVDYYEATRVLEEIVNKTDQKIKSSKLQEFVNKEVWNDWIYNILEKRYFK